MRSRDRASSSGYRPICGSAEAGLSLVGATSELNNRNGFGLDLRAGYTFGTDEDTFNVSVEVNHGFYDDYVGGEMLTSFAMLLGYQRL
jgi:hypothetical protein